MRLLDIGEGLNLVHLSLVPTSVKHRSKRHDLSGLWAKTKYSLHLDGLIPQHFPVEELCIQVWFSIAPHLAVDIIFDTPFIDSFGSKIFPVGRNIVPWNSQPVTIVVRKGRNMKIRVDYSSNTEIKKKLKNSFWRKIKFYCLCDMHSRIKAQQSISCFCHVENEQSIEHSTEVIPIKMSPQSHRPSCYGCIP